MEMEEKKTREEGNEGCGEERRETGHKSRK